MSKREDYNLTFYKKNRDGKIYNICSHNGNGINSVLIFIYRLDNREISSLIDDLHENINFQSNIDEGFYSDSVEHMSIKYEYPNINIDNVLIIPMTEMIELLEEWKEFISPEENSSNAVLNRLTKYIKRIIKE